MLSVYKLRDNFNESGIMYFSCLNGRANRWTQTQLIVMRAIVVASYIVGQASYASTLCVVPLDHDDIRIVLFHISMHLLIIHFVISEYTFGIHHRPGRS